MKSTTCNRSTFAERLVMVSLSTLVETTQKTCVFCMCASTHFVQTPHNISILTAPKFVKCLHDVEDTSRSLCGYRFCDLPNRCEMPAQTMKALYSNLSPFHATKLVAMATSLDRSYQIFSRRNFSSTVLTQQSALRCAHPLSNERGDSSLKHNPPAASHCLPGGLIMWHVFVGPRYTV